MPVTVTGSYLAGRFAQNQQHWADAADFMAAALERNPENLSLVNRTFLLMLGEGSYDEAIALAERLWKAEGGTTLTGALLVTEAVRRDDAAAAVALLDELSPIGLGHYVLPLTSAWLAASRDQTDDALAALAPLAETPGFAPLHDLHAALLADVGGRPDEAARWYEKVMEDRDAPLRVTQLVGNFLERQGRAAEARELYEAFASRVNDPVLMAPAQARLAAGTIPEPAVATARDGLAGAMFNIASALHQEGASKMAILYARLAQRLRPEMPLVNVLVADVLAEIGRFDAAMKYYRTASEHPALLWSAGIRVVDMIDRLGRTGDALLELEVLERTVDPARAAVERGDLLRTAVRYAEAIAAYDAALDALAPIDEPDWRVLYARGVAHDKNGDWPSAEADLVRAVELAPDQPLLLNYLGYSWVDRGIKLEQAHRMIERAVELRPGDGYIIDSLGWSLYRQGDFEGAVRHLERAAALVPHDPTINDHLGDAYWQVGRRIEARFQWRHALAAETDEERARAIEAKLAQGLPADAAVTAKHAGAAEQK